MANPPPLSTGCLERILKGNMVERPVLQVLSIKKIQSSGGGDNPSSDRYRLQMSDGEKYQPCMLASQMNPKIHSNEIHQHCVVMFNRYTCNTIHERRIIIIVDMSVLMPGQSVGGAIGKPSMLDIVRVDKNPQGPVMTAGRGFESKGGQAPVAAPSGNAYQARGGAGNFNRNQNTFNGGTKMETGAGSLSKRDVFPISSLSPYQNRWTIRARVSSNPSIRTWSNSRGEGRVFSVDLVDESGEIKASGFNQVADKLHPMFQLGKVYYISKGRLKPANAKFNTTNNQYELSLNEDTEVELCTDSSSESSLPTIQYNFRPISEIESVEPDTLIDVIGVCKDVSEVSSIVTKTTNRKLNKRDVFLLDRSGHMVSCTLWGSEADDFDGSQFPVVAVKGARVSDFGGRSLSTTFNSVMVINPDIPEAHTLRGWYDSAGKNQDTRSISGRGGGGGGGAIDTPVLILSQVKELDLGRNEKPDYFSCKGTVAFARKENCLYQACPTPDCNKKVTESTGKDYFCEKCNRNFNEFKYRMILSVNIADHSGSQWLTCFQETAKEVLGADAQHLGNLRSTDETAYDDVFQKAMLKDFMFKIRAKIDMFNDEQRLKCICVSANPLNYSVETRKRVQDIKALMAK